MDRLSELMSAQQSGLRLRRMQKLCSSSGLDALLFVAGMDGKYHAGTQMAFSYLFCGHSGRDVIDAGKLPDCLEDVVLVVTPNEVSAFCHEQAYAELVKLIVPNFGAANIVCPSQREAEDPDLYEELKIASFVQFLRNYQRIGIPLSNEIRDGVHISGDTREVDTWPLIQAYGLEGVGKPGFFTQNYLVEGIQRAAQQMYCQLDALALEQLLQHNAVNMRKHWQELSVSMTEQSPQSMTELTVAQPLLNYFTHGTIRNAVEVRQVVTMPPRVLFGSHSNDEMAKSGATTMADVVISAGHPCVHMTVEAADPKSPMRAARTFFLARGAQVKDLFSDGEQANGHAVANGTGHSTQDLVHLARLYGTMVSAAQAAMQHFALQEGATVQSAREVAEQQMLQRAAQAGVPLRVEDLQQSLHFTLHSADHTNRVTGEARQYARKVKVLRMALHNVRSQSPDHPGALLGAVVYADSFVEVEGGLGERPQLLVLTAAVPVCKFFSCDPAEARAAATAHRNLATWLSHTSHTAPAATTPSSLRPASAAQVQPGASTLPSPLGQLLSTGGGEEVLVLTGAQLLPAVVGYVHFFANGLIFRSRTSNLLPLDVRYDVVSVAIQRLECPVAGVPPIGDSLVITGRSSACGLAPASVLSNNPCLVIPLASLAPMNRRQLLVKVLPMWQQACRECDVSWQKDLQPGTPLGAQLYPLQWYALAMGGKRWPVPLQDVDVDRALRRLDRLELAAAFPPNPAVEAVLLRHRITHSSSPPHESRSPAHSRLAETAATIALSPAPDSTVSVVLVVGLPGAEQPTVAAAIAEVVGDNACVVLQQPVQGAQLEQAVLDQALDAAVAELQNLPGPAATLILTTACYSSTVNQLAMLAGTRVFREGSCQLAAVVASVSTASFYEDDSCCCQWLPGALEQASPGLVDLVVLSGAKHVNRVQALLYLHNPDTPLVRASWQGIVQAAQKLLGSQAERLAKLQEPALAQQRHCCSASVGAMPRGLLCGSLQCVWMRFDGSIDMALLRAALVKLGGASDSSAVGSTEVEERQVPLDVCGAEQTPVYAIHFSALIRLEEAAAVQEVTASKGRDVTIRELPAGRQPAASALHAPGGTGPGGEVMVIGAGVTASKISGLLQSCQCIAQQDISQVGSTGNGVTEEELRMLQERHRFDPLPEGYYFTGSSYVDPFGDPLQHHPNMDQFVAQHLAHVQLQRQQQANEQAQRAAALVPFKVVEVRETCLGA